MEKKELRKQLEVALIKAVEEVLNKKNPAAAKKISDTIQDAGKKMAKKFYKAAKPEEKPKPEMKPKANPAPKAKSKPAAKAVKPAKKTKSKK